MSRFAEVIIDIAYNKLDRPFTYKVPDRMQQTLQTGSLVLVPFGKGNVMRKGYVIALKDDCDLPPDKVKEIAELPVGDSGYSEDPDGAAAIALAAWMKRQYGSTMAAALKTVLTSRKPGKPVKTREIELRLSREEAEEQLALYVKKHQVARERLLRELMDVPRQPYSLVTSKLHITAPVIRAMAQAGVIEVLEESSFRNPVSFDSAEADAKELSSAQKAIVDGVLADYDAGRSTVSLIHGITGSGKTEVYISIIRGICESGMDRIITDGKIGQPFVTISLSGNSDRNEFIALSVTRKDFLMTDRTGDRIASGGTVIVIGADIPESGLIHEIFNIHILRRTIGTVVTERRDCKPHGSLRKKMIVFR